MAEKLTKALVALARHGIPTDILELLVSGDPMRGIPPGALASAIEAAGRRALQESEK